MKNLAKTQEKEARDLCKWQKQYEKKKKQPSWFVVVSLLLCGMIRLVDEFATAVPTALQTSIAMEFFPNLSMASAIAEYTTIGSMLSMLAIVATVMTMLADKYGRKILVAISAIGIGAGMWICSGSENLTMHLIGRAIVVFFVSADFHNIYITEAAPDNRRSMFIGLASVLGYLGIMLVAAGRIAFTDGNTLNWRGVYAVPAIIALALGVALLFLGTEPEAFLKQKIATLSAPYEERNHHQAKEKKKEKNSSGLIFAFKYLFTHKQSLIATLVFIFNGMAMAAFYNYYEAIMAEAWGTTDSATAMVSRALLVYPIGSAAVAILIAWIGDKAGRKYSCTVAAIVAFVTLLLFIVGANNFWNEYLVGLIFGVEIGAYWAFGNNLGLATNEVIPTEIRATCSAARGIIAIPSALVSGIVVAQLIGYVGNIGKVCLIWGAITMGIGTVLYVVLGKETKGTDLSNVNSD